MIYIGISGWTYAGWRGVFYPKGLPQSKELHFASHRFRSIEINGTHYSLQRPRTFMNWYEQAPREFVFAVKGSRYITHMKRLRGVEIPLANFLASGVLALREKLGPFLWQFPPNFQFEPETMEHFFALLPRSTTGAARLSRKHDAMLSEAGWTKGGPHRLLRHCVEIRHPSFMVPEFFQLLRRHGIAFVFADTAQKWPYSEDVTADFVYIRLHGDSQIYVSGYTDSSLAWWAARIREWSQGREPADAKLISQALSPAARSRDVYVYFDNDIKVRAPADAMSLQRQLGLSVHGPDENGHQ